MIEMRGHEVAPSGSVWPSAGHGVAGHAEWPRVGQRVGVRRAGRHHGQRDQRGHQGHGVRAARQQGGDHAPGLAPSPSAGELAVLQAAGLAGSVARGSWHGQSS